METSHKFRYIYICLNLELLFNFQIDYFLNHHFYLCNSQAFLNIPPLIERDVKDNNIFIKKKNMLQESYSKEE